MFHSLGKATLESLLARATLLMRGDNYDSVIRYLQLVEGVRTDVCAVDRVMLRMNWNVRTLRRAYPELDIPGDFYGPRDSGGFGLRALVAANIDRAPIYLCSFPDGDWELTQTGWDDGFDFEPFGMINRLRRHTPTWDGQAYASEAERLARDLEARAVPLPLAASWEEVLWQDAHNARNRAGIHLVEIARTHGDDPDLLGSAIRLLEPATRGPDEFRPEAYEYIGLAHYRLAKTDPAHVEPMLDAWRQYATHPLPNHQAELDEILRVLEEHHARGGRPN